MLTNSLRETWSEHLDYIMVPDWENKWDKSVLGEENWLEAVEELVPAVETRVYPIIVDDVSSNYECVYVIDRLKIFHHLESMLINSWKHKKKKKKIITKK